MRIISGKFKGKKILRPNDQKTRPLRDLVKESIFNLIHHSKKVNLEIDHANVLDLFSGCGSFGLECISRNAKKVTFVENYREILIILKKNIQNLNVLKNCEIIDEDCFDFIKSKQNSVKNKYDLIFLDPPYKEKKVNFLLDNIKENELLNKDGLIIIHRHKKDDLTLSKKYMILDERNYGISKIIFAN